MSRYAVGDLQGCLDPLKTLLDQVNFDPSADQLWLVGDLINRGPQSLDTLRFIYSLRQSCRVVLGNHDLSLLALKHGVSSPKVLAKGKQDPDLVEIVAAADADQLCDWLIQQPLVIRDEAEDYLMVHAGIPWFWSSDTALALSKEVQAVLRSAKAIDFFKAMYGNKPKCWRNDLTGYPRLRTITNYFTRMRCLEHDGSLDMGFKAAPEDAPAHLNPWYSQTPTNPRKETIIFGHWAALNGNTNKQNAIGLDTGCVWGNCMTLFDMDNKTYYRAECS